MTQQLERPDVVRDDNVEGDPKRVIALSDGIFAVAMTLLVLDIPVPEVGQDVSVQTAVHNAWPHIAVLGLSFLVLASIWRAHRRTYLWVRQVNPRMIRLTMSGLFATILIPFTAALLSRYGAETLSVTFYAGSLTLVNLLQMALFHLVWRHDHLQARPIPDAVAHSVMMNHGIQILVFGISIPIAFIWPLGSILLWQVLVPLLVIHKVLEHRAEHRHAIA